MADLPPVIAVDWNAVEAEIGREIDPELRRVIEHEGSSSSVVLDRWGYADEASIGLFSALRDHARILHPDRGELHPRYAPFGQLDAVVSAFKVLRGEDLNVGTIVEDGPTERFPSLFVDLYDAAVALDEQRMDWPEGRHPHLSYGSYGPDTVGNLYITAAHPDREALETLVLSDLPVEREHILSFEGGDRFRATYRHERYYGEEEPTVADDRAAEIGFLGANSGKRVLVQDFADEGIEYRERDAPDVDGVPVQLTLYEYEMGDETRYGVEWTQRVTIDDYVVRSLIFDHRPSESDIQTALLIEEWRLNNRFG